jgi:uncharacterized protein
MKPGKNNISFTTQGITYKGHLFLPQDYQEGNKFPGVIVTGSWTTVKEQMPDLYASRLAEKGFATLTFDFRYYGESGGEPRQYESPQTKIEDIKHALTFFETLDAVDPNKIGGLSICASAGYMATAVAEDSRFKSFVAVAPWLHDAELVKAMYGGDEGVKEKIDRGNKSREKYEKTDEMDYVPACSATDSKAAMYGAVFDYYLNPKRGAIPQWKNQFALMSWPEWLEFSAMPKAKEITVPALFVHSENAAIPDGAKKFFKDIPGKKDFFWTQGTQFDFYDNDEQVNKSVALAALHLEKMYI